MSKQDISTVIRVIHTIDGAIARTPWLMEQMRKFFATLKGKDQSA